MKIENLKTKTHVCFVFHKSTTYYGGNICGNVLLNVHVKTLENFGTRRVMI